MSMLVSRLEALRRQQKLRKHPIVGTARIHTSSISGGTDWSTVPGKCVLRLERRLIPGEGPDDAVREFRELIQQASKGDKDLRARVRLVHHADSMEVTAKQPHVQLLLEEARNFTGKCQVIGVPYWTDASILVNQAKIPSCLFGPGDIKFAHSKNENIKIADVLAAARIYAATAQRYSG
jgi:acetylornithine deacetylase/succinyl-diaminopimelate desuccinylase-like protein